MEIVTIGQAIFDLFFPKRCIYCNLVISNSNPLCVRCSSNLPFTHWHLGTENLAYLKLQNLCEIEFAYSLLYFRHGNVTQSLLHALKYENQSKIGALLAEKVLLEMDFNLFDGIIPVPIHPKKLKQRGYNQVMSFSEKLAIETGVPLYTNLLIRIQNNPSQVYKSREERFSSIKGAFELTTKNLTGHYILIDDVITTGATLSTCVQALKKNTNLKISVITIAFAK
ncbi:MAG: ComF family protein [Moheibacter sp.]